MEKAIMENENKNILDETKGLSKVQLLNSTNGKLLALYSTLDISNSKKFNIGGRDHAQIRLDSSELIKVAGNRLDLDIDSCSRVYTRGNHTLAKLKNCRNFLINGNQSTIAAENASHVTVQGNRHRVDIMDVELHTFRTATVENKNVVDISCAGLILSDGKGYEARVFNDTKGNSEEVEEVFKEASAATTEPLTKSWMIKFLVEYVQSAKVTNHNYELGIFSFTMTRPLPTYFEVTLDDSSIEIEGGSSTDDSASVEIEARGKSNGKVQTLELKAPADSTIEIITPHVFHIILPKI